jgi:hypothetical protein
LLPDSLVEAGSDQLSEALRLVDRKQPLFLVVDHAASRPELLLFLHTMLYHGFREAVPKVRIVLIDRHHIGWYTHLLDSNPFVEVGTRFFEPIHLRDISATGPTRLRLLQAAIDAFTRLRDPAPPDTGGNRFVRAAMKLLTGTRQPPPIRPDATTVADPLFGRVLAIQMAALALVERRPCTPDRLLDSLAASEIEACSLPPDDRERKVERSLATADAAVTRMLAAFGLLGGVSSLERARQVCGLAAAPAPEAWMTKVRLWPRLAADTDTSGNRLGKLEAEVLGDRLVAMALTHPETKPGFVSDVTAGASPAALRHAFATLFRCSADKTLGCEALIGQLLQVDFDTRI